LEQTGKQMNKELWGQEGSSQIRGILVGDRKRVWEAHLKTEKKAELDGIKKRINYHRGRRQGRKGESSGTGTSFKKKIWTRNKEAGVDAI